MLISRMHSERSGPKAHFSWLAALSGVLLLNIVVGGCAKDTDPSRAADAIEDGDGESTSGSPRPLPLDAGVLTDSPKGTALDAGTSPRGTAENNAPDSITSDAAMNVGTSDSQDTTNSSTSSATASGVDSGAISSAGEPAPSADASVSADVPPADQAVPDCEAPGAGMGSCFFDDICHEGADEFGSSVTQSICLEGLGFYPSDEACPLYQFIGRCYDSDPGAWDNYYNEYLGPTPEQLQAQCEDQGRLWCNNPLGVTVAVAAECNRACDEARPDYTDAPECAGADSCESDCMELAIKADGCAECVTAGLYWEEGYCGEFECHCPPPTFESTP